MKWYDYIILRFQEYKWVVFTPFAILLAIMFVLGILKTPSDIPAYIFVMLLIMWTIIWLIASYFYRKNLNK